MNKNLFTKEVKDESKNVNKYFEALVKEAIEDIIFCGEWCFSVWDVTQDLIKRHRNITFVHKEVRDIVTEFFSNPSNVNEDFEKTLVRLENGKVTWLYSSDGFDLEDYEGFESVIKRIPFEQNNNEENDITKDFKELIEQVDKFILGDSTLDDLELALHSANKVMNQD